MDVTPQTKTGIILYYSCQFTFSIGEYFIEKQKQ